MEASIFAEGFFALTNIEVKCNMTIVVVGKNRLQLSLLLLKIEY